MSDAAEFDPIVVTTLEPLHAAYERRIESLTTQLQAAQAVIARARLAMKDDWRAEGYQAILSRVDSAVGAQATIQGLYRHVGKLAAALEAVTRPVSDNPEEVVSEAIIPNAEPDPREASRRNRAALRYLHHCGFMRMEPSKHRIEAILLGREFFPPADLELTGPAEQRVEWGLSNSALDSFPKPHFTGSEDSVRMNQRRGHPLIKVVSRTVGPWVEVGS